MADTTTSEVDRMNSEKQLALMEHLAELRTRIVRSIIYAGVGTIAGWSFYRFFFRLLCAPVTDCLTQKGSSFLLTGVTEGFTIKMQISVLIGVILALPLITWEAWRFIEPGLTRSEKRAFRLIAPLSIILFIFGIVVAYWLLPTGIKWLVAQNPPEAKFMPSVAQTLIFILKMYLGFGLTFQMPVILMFLGKVGLINSRMLRSYWRYAVVLIGIIAAVVTPSGDAFTMTMMALPMIGLYILSIGLVRLVEK